MIDKNKQRSRNWVVFIMDPDYNDSSPFSVTADDLESAIEKAISDWRSWLADDGVFDPAVWGEPEIVTFYRGISLRKRVP